MNFRGAICIKVSTPSVLRSVVPQLHTHVSHTLKNEPLPPLRTTILTLMHI
jgi:hypothetical protein